MTYLAGNALLQAAQKIKAALLESAGKMLNLTADQLVYDRGNIILPNGDCFEACEFSSRATDKGEPIGAIATASFPYPEESTPQHLPIGMPHVKYVFGAQVVRVEVDLELGTIEVKDVVAIHDVGKIINRAAVEGQIEGGVAMGIGYALYEDMPLKSNQKWVDSFTEYLLPTALDIPGNLEIKILEMPDLSGPFGAKGVAEIAVVPTAPAIANAVYAACQVRVRDLPITAEKIITMNIDIE
jgi:CO/xanthine dehydrogenase Mo-binding subunit